MKYIVAFFTIILGFIMIAKTEWFLQSFGSIRWAEEHLGTEGGSRLMYKLIGLGLIILALLGVTGLLGEMITGFFSGFFGAPKS